MTNPNSTAGALFLSEGGEMGERIRGFDWSSHPLGPPEGWPAGLRTVMRLMLRTKHPIFIFWGADHYCFYNDAYRRSVGPEKHPAMLGGRGRDFWDEIWPLIEPQIDLVMREGGATWYEDQLVPITRFGRREDVYWTYSYGPIEEASAPGGVGGVLVICAETTENVRLRRSLAEEADRLKRLFEQAPSFIAELRGPEHHFEGYNNAYLALIGYRELRGLTVREAIPEAEGQGYIALLDRVYSTGAPYIGKGARFDVERPRGSTPQAVYVDFIYQPIRGADGDVEGIFVVGHDVTDQYLSMAGLREADERKNEFLAMLAHELRNPLAPMRNALRVFEHEDLSEAGRQALGMGRRQVVHLTRLVDDLLEVSRVTRGLIDLRPESVMIQHVVYGVIEGLVKHIDERRIQLTVDMPGRPLQLRADPVRLAQIVENLLNNACKYTDAGGEVSITVREHEGAVEVEVKDNGIGIEPDHLQRIFGLFTQVESAIDRSRGGLGIGLHLVRHLVTLHKGTVSAHSEGPGAGSRFLVTLPVPDAHAQPDARQRAMNSRIDSALDANLAPGGRPPAG